MIALTLDWRRLLVTFYLIIMSSFIITFSNLRIVYLKKSYVVLIWTFFFQKMDISQIHIIHLGAAPFLLRTIQSAYFYVILFSPNVEKTCLSVLSGRPLLFFNIKLKLSRIHYYFFLLWNVWNLKRFLTIFDVKILEWQWFETLIITWHANILVS